MLSNGTLTRFDRLVRFLNAATKSLTTDIPNIKEMAKVGLQFKDIGLKRIRFITVPFVYSTAQPGRVEWTADADDPVGPDRQRQAARQAAGRLDRRRPGAERCRPSGSTVLAPTSPSDDESESTTTSSPSDTESSTSESPSDTASPTDEPSDGIDASAGRPRVRRALHMTEPEREQPEPDWERRRRLAEVFGDVLPDTTADERDPAERSDGADRARRRLAQGAGAAAPRADRSGAGRCAARTAAASRSRISWSSLMSSGVPGSGLGK